MTLSMDVLVNVHAIDAAGVRQLALTVMLGLGANLNIQYDLHFPCICLFRLMNGTDHQTPDNTDYVLAVTMKIFKATHDVRVLHLNTTEMYACTRTHTHALQRERNGRHGRVDGDIHRTTRESHSRQWRAVAGRDRHKPASTAAAHQLNGWHRAGSGCGA
jgi:hypothetical protein